MFKRICFFAVLFFFATQLSAEKIPLWDFGLGLGLITYPDYHGSNRYRLLPIPVPLYVYRGEVVEIDDDGFRSHMLRNEYYKFDFSAGAGPPVYKKNNKEREGMNSLDAAGEFGLELHTHLMNIENRQKLDLIAAHRLIYSFGRKYIAAYRGTTTNVVLHYERNYGSRYDDYWRGVIKVGPIFGSDKNHDYYYSVKDEYATDERPAYQAEGGYAGMGYLVFISHRLAKWWYSVFVKYEDLRNAAYIDSPLVKTEDYFAVGGLFAYILTESDVHIER